MDQQLLHWLTTGFFGVLTVWVGWKLNAGKSEKDEHRKELEVLKNKMNDHELMDQRFHSEVSIKLYKDFVTKDDHSKDMIRIEGVIQTGFNEIKGSLGDLSEKLDQKKNRDE